MLLSIFISLSLLLSISSCNFINFSIQKQSQALSEFLVGGQIGQILCIWSGFALNCSSNHASIGMSSPLSGRRHGEGCLEEAQAWIALVRNAAHSRILFFLSSNRRCIYSTYYLDLAERLFLCFLSDSSRIRIQWAECVVWLIHRLIFRVKKVNRSFFGCSCFEIIYIKFLVISYYPSENRVSGPSRSARAAENLRLKKEDLIYWMRSWTGLEYAIYRLGNLQSCIVHFGAVLFKTLPFFPFILLPLVRLFLWLSIYILLSSPLLGRIILRSRSFTWSSTYMTFFHLSFCHQVFHRTQICSVQVPQIQKASSPRQYPLLEV